MFCDGTDRYTEGHGDSMSSYIILAIQTRVRKNFAHVLGWVDFELFPETAPKLIQSISWNAQEFVCCPYKVCMSFVSPR